MAKRPEPGWYADPSTQGRQERWWDGSDWTDRVRAFADPQVEPPAKRERSRFPIRLALPLLILLVAAGVIAYAMARDQDVEGVRFGDGGLEVAFASSRSVSSTEIEEKQGELEQEVQSLKETAQSEARTAPPAPAATDLSGDWAGANGLSYRIQQFGANAVITEMSPFGISAVGQGTVGADGARFSYQAADGSTGEAALRLVNSSTLEGTFTNFSFGTTVPVRLTR
jgi:hypothetical protein